MAMLDLIGLFLRGPAGADHVLLTVGCLMLGAAILAPDRAGEPANCAEGGQARREDLRDDQVTRSNTYANGDRVQATLAPGCEQNLSGLTVDRCRPAGPQSVDCRPIS